MKLELKLNNLIKTKSFLQIDNTVKIVLCVSRRTYEAHLTVGGKEYNDLFNDDEPYDRLTHVFCIPEDKLNESKIIKFKAKLFRNRNIILKTEFAYGIPVFSDKNELMTSCDHLLKPESEETSELAEGITYIHRLYKDKDNLPVHVHITKADTKFASLYIGTPEDGYEKYHKRATIPDMITSACSSGHDVIAGVNADFFDIFGDFHPAGLCIKNGKVISDPCNGRTFLAQLKDGSYIITNEKESPAIKDEIFNAASGLQMIVKDGKINDFAPNEPFGYIRHPRTGAGLTKDGKILLFVVDGRIPEHSNGASLVDLAKLMIAEGADRAINMDGGGSSAMYIKENNDHILKNRPADLFRPKANLIRKDFNSFLIIRK